MRNFGRLFGTFVITVVVGGLAVGACFAALVPGTVDIVTAHKYSVHEVDELRDLSERTKVFWDDGTSLMGTLGTLDREIVSLDQVPISKEWSKWLWPVSSRSISLGVPSALTTRRTAAVSGLNRWRV